MRFDFFEANILKQTFYDGCAKNVLMDRFDVLLCNTKDPTLRKSILSLVGKIEQLSNEDLERITSDIKNNRFILTSYYKVLN